MDGSLLRRTSLLATLGLTSHAEFAAGVAADLPLWHYRGFPIGLPMLLPIAIDCYVVDALERRQGGDRWAALGILALSVIGGSAYTASDAIGAAKAAGVGVILVLVLYRLYAPAKPSRAALDAQAAEARERQDADDRERRQMEAASRLRIEEAERLAAIEARREQDAAFAHAQKVNAEVAAETARLEAATAAEVARIRAQADADSANREPAAPANPKRTRSRTAGRKPAKAPAKASANAAPPAKDEAVRRVAEAIREHQGDEPYVFEWTDWQAAHGGGKTFWWGVHKAATEPVHLAEAAS